MKVNCEAGTRVNLSRTLRSPSHTTNSTTSADFYVQDAGANQSSVLSWRRSVPGSHGSARGSHAACYQACCFSAAVASLFCPRSGSRWLPDPFHFPRLLCFHGICWSSESSPILKPPSSSWESNNPTQSQAKQLPSKGLASCSSRASKSMASPKMQQKHLHS